MNQLFRSGSCDSILIVIMTVFAKPNFAKFRENARLKKKEDFDLLQKIPLNTEIEKINILA